MLTSVVAECKEAGWEDAQAAKKAALDAAAADTAAAATVKTDYDAKSAFSTSGETNTLCAYTSKDTPRPECAEGYCCGAAQKVLRDGTKLAMETCQLLGTATY